MPYRHAGDLRYMPDQVIGSPYRYEPNLLQRVGQFAKAVVQIVKSQSILGVEDHQIGEYCRKLNAIAEARTQGRWPRILGLIRIAILVEDRCVTPAPS